LVSQESTTQSKGTNKTQGTQSTTTKATEQGSSSVDVTEAVVAEQSTELTTEAQDNGNSGVAESNDTREASNDTDNSSDEGRDTGSSTNNDLSSNEVSDNDTSTDNSSNNDSSDVNENTPTESVSEPETEPVERTTHMVTKNIIFHDHSGAVCATDSISYLAYEDGTPVNAEDAYYSEEVGLAIHLDDEDTVGYYWGWLFPDGGYLWDDNQIYRNDVSRFSYDDIDMYPQL
jgi:hypothetical protein